jgi:hypothetical protein
MRLLAKLALLRYQSWQIRSGQAGSFSVSNPEKGERMHPQFGKLGIDIDDDFRTQWGGGLSKLSRVRVNGQPVAVWYFDPHLKQANGDWVTNPADLETSKNLGATPAMRFVTSWYDGQPPEVVAKAGSDFIARLDAGTRRVACVEWDVELQQGKHDIGWQQKFLLGYRVVTNQQTTMFKGIRGAGGLFPNPKQPASLGYRWGRPGVWTMEGMQDASSNVANLAAETGLLIGPQCYNGPMSERWDAWFEVLTWCMDSNPWRQFGAKVPIEKFIPYYDARKDMRFPNQNYTVMYATSRLTELYE